MRLYCWDNKAYIVKHALRRTYDQSYTLMHISVQRVVSGGTVTHAGCMSECLWTTVMLWTRKTLWDVMTVGYLFPFCISIFDPLHCDTFVVLIQWGDHCLVYPSCESITDRGNTNIRRQTNIKNCCKVDSYNNNNNTTTFYLYSLCISMVMYLVGIKLDSFLLFENAAKNDTFENVVTFNVLSGHPWCTVY